MTGGPLENRRPGESIEDFAQRIATGFVGINEQQEAEALIEILARRHGFDLRDDRFSTDRSAPCREQQPCDGAIVAAALHKLLGLLQATTTTS